MTEKDSEIHRTAWDAYAMAMATKEGDYMAVLAALEAVYPLISNEAIERAAEVAEKEAAAIGKRVLLANKEPPEAASAAFHMCNGLHTAAPRIAQAIRALTTPSSKGE